MNISRCLGLYTLLIFCLGYTKGQCQDFRLINSNKIYTYTKVDSAEYEKYFLFIKIDSAKALGTDSIFYFNRLLDTVPGEMCMSDTTSIGARMIIKNDTDATHVFFNKNEDSIFVKTKVAEGDSWVMYTFPDNSYVKAYVISKLYGGILPNIFDTLYRIKLNVFSEEGLNLTDVFPNDTKMDITKNYGMVEFWPMQTFPEEHPALILRGITSPDTNYVDVDARTCFDFLIGNEFHYEETVATSSGITHSLQKNFVLGRQNFTDHVTYEMLRVLWQEVQTDFDTDTIRIVDTVEINYNYADYKFLDTIELKIFEHTRMGYSDWLHNDSLYAGLPYKNVFEWYESDADMYCVTNPDGNMLPEQSYGDGFGTIHYFDSTSVENYYHFDLVYFQKGLLEWGNPISFDSLGFTPVENITGTEEIFIYPNPVSEWFNIQAPANINGNFTLNIYNTLGQLIKAEEHLFIDNSHKIYCSDLPKGNYIVRLSNSERSFHGCFIKY